MRTIRAFDVFCGAGGSSWGAALAGVQIVGGVDSAAVAISTYSANFPNAHAMLARAEDVNLVKLKRKIGRIDLLLASPECTNHTHARGSTAPDDSSRKKAYQVVRYARVLKPRWLIVENVVNMENWDEYPKFVRALERLGYQTRLEKLNAADFGVPQSRRRMFLLGDRETEPRPIQLPRRKKRHAADVINLDGKYKWSALYRKTRAQPTIRRAKRAERVLGRDVSYLLVYYGTDKAGGWQGIHVPLRTITTVDRFAVVTRVNGRPRMRMLQVEELVKAMGFNHSIAGRGFRLADATRREKVKLLGNAVCPPVMEYLVRALTVVR